MGDLFSCCTDIDEQRAVVGNQCGGSFPYRFFGFGGKQAPCLVTHIFIARTYDSTAVDPLQKLSVTEDVKVFSDSLWRKVEGDG